LRGARQQCFKGLGEEEGGAKEGNGDSGGEESNFEARAPKNGLALIEVLQKEEVD